MINLLACNCYVKKIQEKLALGNFQLKNLNTGFCEFGYEEHLLKNAAIGSIFATC